MDPRIQITPNKGSDSTTSKAGSTPHPSRLSSLSALRPPVDGSTPKAQQSSDRLRHLRQAMEAEIGHIRTEEEQKAAHAKQALGGNQPLGTGSNLSGNDDTLDFIAQMRAFMSEMRARPAARAHRARKPRKPSPSEAEDTEESGAESDSGYGWHEEPEDSVDDELIAAQLHRLKTRYRNSAMTWVTETEFNEPRNKRECQALAQLVDSYRREHPGFASRTLDLMLRRMVGVHLADVTGDWGMCAALQGDIVENTLLDNDQLRIIQKKAKMYASLGRHSKHRPAPSKNGKPAALVSTTPVVPGPAPTSPSRSPSRAPVSHAVVVPSLVNLPRPPQRLALGAELRPTPNAPRGRDARGLSTTSCADALSATLAVPTPAAAFPSSCCSCVAGQLCCILS